MGTSLEYSPGRSTKDKSVPSGSLIFITTLLFVNDNTFGSLSVSVRVLISSRAFDLKVSPGI